MADLHCEPPVGVHASSAPGAFQPTSEQEAQAMGSDDELRSPLGVTPQQHYYARRYFLEHHGTPEEAAEFSAGGPPPPRPADGVTGKILYYEANLPTVEEFAGLLAEMENGGWITTEVREKVAELPRADGVAELKARMVERDSGERQQAAGTE
ncbi:hypothetical protein [Nocardia sp. NPDC050175]|uniref:hypothetical protein n=1 Tax=Nocardia sp. NPDC050175 TaxID=3364317 RepID=UPI0037AB31C6